jgi:ABC-type antimicrobial peptide transport system permease subunit
VDEIIIDTGKAETVPEARRRIENILMSRHRGVKDFKVEDFKEMVQNMLNRMRKRAIQVLSVGIVAILAGGVGIMNVTLATIFSRIREIGVRRAIGATKLDIMIQFVTEAMLLGIIGGVAGIALGLIGLNYLMDDGEEVIQSLVWWHFLATMAISALVGFIFSLYPAYQASKLDPVEALRYE